MAGAGDHHAATTAASEASCLLGLGWYLIPACFSPSLPAGQDIPVSRARANKSFSHMTKRCGGYHGTDAVPVKWSLGRVFVTATKPSATICKPGIYRLG